MTQMSFWKGTFALMFLAAAVYFLGAVWTVLIPFILGVAAAYLIHPLVERFEARGLRRDRVVIVLYLALLSAVILLGFLFLPTLFREARVFAAELPSYAASFDDMIVKVNRSLSSALGGVLGARAQAFQLPFRAEQLLDDVFAIAPGNLIGYAHFGLWAIIIPFVAFFSLSQGRRWINAVFDLTPAPYVERLLGLLAEINATLGAYVRGQLIEGACVGVVTMIGLAMIGFDGAVLFGVLTAVMNVVPMMAPIVGGGLALFMGYFQGLPPVSLFGILCLFVLVRLLDDFIFIPFVLGHSVNLHPVVIVFAVLAGFEIGGFLGLVFAVPAAAVLKVILSLTLGERSWSPSLDERHIVS